MEIAYYAILPASVRYDTKLSTIAKLLYAEITATVNYKRWCYEKLDFWAKLFNVKEETIVRHLRVLDKEDYIIREIKPGTANKIILPTKSIDKVVRVEIKRPVDNLGDISKKVVQLWNNLFGDMMSGRFRRTDQFDEMLTDRLDSFTEDEILSALQNRHDYVRISPWHNKPENRHTMPRIDLVLDSDESLLKWLTTKTGADTAQGIKPVETDDHDVNLLE